jgi:hypothetical protein
VLASEQPDEFFMNGFDQLLRRIEAGREFLADDLLLDSRNERLDDRQRHVCFEKGAPNFPQSIGYRFFSKAPLAPQFLEKSLKLLA